MNNHTVSFSSTLSRLLHSLTHSIDLSMFGLDLFHPAALTFTHFLAITVVFLITLLTLTRRWRNRNLPPGPYGWPVIGRLRDLLHNPHLKLSYWRDVYGDVYMMTCGRRHVVVLNSLEAVLEGLIDKGEQLGHRPDFLSYTALYGVPTRDLGICTSDLQETASVRKLFVNTVVDTYCSDASRVEDKLQAEIVDTLNTFSDLEAPFDPGPLLQLACLNLSLNLTFSQRFDPNGRVAKEILKTFEQRSDVFTFHATDFLPLLRIFTTDDHVTYIRERSEDLTECHRKLLNVHKDTYNPQCLRDFTDHLLFFLEQGEDQGMFNTEEIERLLLDMAGYGFQAIGVTLTWLLGYMALNRDVQTEVHKEIDAVVGRDRLPCLEDQPYLPLTEAVIYEVERLASVRPFLIPHAARATTVIQGHEIPADSVVLFNVWGLHHDPRYWPNPSKFNPYRFLKEEKTLEIPDHFIPYGAGRRQCPGESLADVELFLFFASLMHQLHVLPADPNMTLDGVFDHLLRPKPFLITVAERD
nr:hypothetical protein BaRGS_022414 [Batillaria attramentaria]